MYGLKNIYEMADFAKTFKKCLTYSSALCIIYVLSVFGYVRYILLNPSKLAKSTRLLLYCLDFQEETTVANIKSAKKRILVINKKTLRNKMIKSAVKTAIKKVALACQGDKAQAQAALVAATKAIDMACTKGVYHKNNASRKKSRLAKLVNKVA
jgi:small subunit ribosomal protein S20